MHNLKAERRITDHNQSMMRPEEYIDENRVPTDEGFAHEQVDERELLRKSINRSCRANTILYVILAILFAINGIVKYDDVSESKLYLCPLIASMMAAALAMGFYAIIYNRIRQDETAREMQQHLDLIGSNTLFSKLIVIIMTMCITAAAVLGLIDKSPWYVIVLAAIGIIAAIGGVWWLLKYTGKADPRDEDLEKLLTLEEKEK